MHGNFQQRKASSLKTYHNLKLLKALSACLFHSIPMNLVFFDLLKFNSGNPVVFETTEAHSENKIRQMVSFAISSFYYVNSQEILTSQLN